MNRPSLPTAADLMQRRLHTVSPDIPIEAGVRLRLAKGLVRDHMTKALETVAPSDDVLSLSSRFTQGHHRRLLVVENGRLVDLIAHRDLMRALEDMERQRSHARSKSTYELMDERHRKLD